VTALMVLAFAAAAAIPAAAQEAPEMGSGPGHTIAFGAGYALPPFGGEDAYSGAIGAVLRYEISSLLPIPLIFASSLGLSGFVPRESGFGSSFMIQIGILVQYPVMNLPLAGLSLEALPYLGYKHYLRWHDFEGESTFSYRPIAATGFDVRLLGQRWIGGLRFEYDAIFDNEVRHSLAFEPYVGVKF